MFMRRWFKSKSEREQSLWSFLSGQLLKTKGDLLDSEVKIKANRRRMFLTGSVLALIVILFFVIEPSFAQASNNTSVTKTIANWAIGILAKIVVWLAEQLGYILIFLIELLINVVQYNNFVKATPVQIGWPLIRDTVNMFFIVVVLVSAFATIIGYPKDFNYKQVLPKLLVMAILINFSKTLIGLLIDFSQVIVLTFVNGFKQAAGGNFVSALGIAKIMRLTATTGTIEESGDSITINISNANATGVQPWSLMSILVSAIFAIWIISISISLILIMLIFFLARIIMLWFLLITSPVAFFAWSLPGQLKNALGSFTNEWWSRLSSALVGGPTMAFFLWLSLAMAQRQADLVGPTGIYDPAKVSTEVTQFQQSTSQSGQVTPSEFGDPQVFATFIIMVAFMLVGVQTSVKFASSVAPGTEKLVGALGSSKAGFGLAGGAMAGMLAGRVAARGARVAGTGVKIAGKGALAVGREAESRFGVVAGAASGLRKNKYFTVLPTSIQKGVGSLASAPQKAAKDKAALLEQTTAGMSPSERLAFLENQKSLMEKSPIKSRIGDMMGVNLALAKQATSSLTSDDLKEKYEKEETEALKLKLGRDLTEEEKLEVKGRAQERTQERLAALVQSGKKTAKEHGDEDTFKKFNEMIEKNPALAGDAAALSKQGGNDATLMESERKVKPEAYMHAAYALSFAKGKGWIDDNGRLLPKALHDKQYGDFMRGNQGKYLKAHLEYAQTEGGKSQVKQLITKKSADGKDLSDEELNKLNYTVNVSQDGAKYTVVQKRDNTTNSNVTAKFDRTTNEPEKIMQKASPEARAKIEKNIGNLGAGVTVGDLGRELPKQVAEQLGEDLESLAIARQTADKGVGAQAEIAEKYLQHDLSTKALFNHDSKTGNFADEAGRKAYEKTIESLVSKIKADDYSEETLSALASIGKQVGDKGEAFDMLQKQLSNLSQEEILHSMTSGNTKHQASIQLMYANVIDKANQQKDDAQIDTDAIKFRENAFKAPVKGTDNTGYKRQVETQRRVQKLLFEGKD